MNEFLRYAAKDDIDLLFEWANDKETRQNSFTANQISYQEHQKWFSKMLSDPSCMQFIYMAGDLPIGQIRLSVEGDTAEISYSVNPSCRKKGYGKKMLSALQRKIKADHPGIRKLTAKVKPTNEASKKIFTTAGFSQTYESYEIILDKIEDLYGTNGTASFETANDNAQEGSYQLEPKNTNRNP